MIFSFFGRLFRQSSIIRFLSIICFFAVATVIGIGITNISHKKPELDSVSPTIGEAGGIVILRGKYFDDTRGNNRVEVAGESLTESSYLKWSDTLIMIKIPEIAENGLIQVVNKHGKSNPHIFAKRDTIPIIPQKYDSDGYPEISSLSSTNVEIGKEIIITGKNFGITRNNSIVYFAWQSDKMIPLAGNIQPEQICTPCSDHDFDYESWSDQEIRVQVPDGATNGNIYVQTDKGLSNPVSLQIVNQPGTREYSNKRTYVIAMQVDITNINATEGNTLFLRIPMPEETVSQRSFQITASDPLPYMANYRGIILHQLENLEPNINKKITHTFLLSSYAVSTSINPTQVKQYSDVKKQLYVTYTAPNRIIPSDNKTILETAAKITGTQKNPWRKAKLIYSWLIDHIQYETVTNQDRPVIQALEKQSGDAYDMAILFCALSRASGIPTIPVAGILVDENRNTRIHWWAEFYIENFGWIPVDPGLGAGIPVKLRDADRKEWFFGNLGANHIAFSRGWTDQKPMTPNSKIVYKPRTFAFQAIWEEASGNITGYTSFWHTPQITGIY